MAKQLVTVADALSAAGRKFKHVASNDLLHFQQEKEHMLAIMDRNKTLQTCTPESIRDALLQAASMGLSVNPVLGHVYMIPRAERRKERNESWDDYNNTVKKICYASPGYKGLVYLAKRTESIRFVRSDIVYSRDRFEMTDIEGKPVFITDVKKPRGEPIGVFCSVKLPTGEWLTDYMDKDTVQKIRSRSDNPNSLMWKELWTEGWKKAVIRRAWKLWPINFTERLSTAVNVMDKYEGVTIDQPQEENVPALEATLTEEEGLRLWDKLEGFGEQRDTVLARIQSAYHIEKVNELRQSDLMEVMKGLDSLIEQRH